MREVFISYKSNDPTLGNIDETVANELCKAIEAAGISCWIAPRDIEPGARSYEGAIIRAIKDCNVMLLVFSKFTNDSDDVFKEVANAARRRKQIIPFKIDNSEPNDDFEYHLGSVQWVDAHGDYRKKISELIDALKHKLGKRDNGQTIMVDAPATMVSKPEEPARLTFNVKGVSFNMIRVEGGIFTMGATPEQGWNAQYNEKPAHQVELSTFLIGETQVTQELWTAVMGENPSKYKGDVLRPVDSVSWEDCQKFITRLNKMKGCRFRLPTEAEWEFAARGGNKSKGFKYAGSNNIDEVAWYGGNSGQVTRPVSLKKANELGLFDMSGNINEWCQNWYYDYSNSFKVNPIGLSSGTARVLRGGGYEQSSGRCRVSSRMSCRPDMDKEYLSYFNNLGFRLALDE